MRIPALYFLATIPWLVSCGSAPPPAPAKKAEVPKPFDESHRFPTENLVGTKVFDAALTGKPFMPGGTLATYRKGKIEYEMFVSELPSATDAAILLPDWRRALKDAKLIPSFGGYFGDNEGRPMFVFTKGAWIAGVAGLPEKDADRQARILAAQLN
jgi:hypothetical protein